MNSNRQLGRAGGVGLALAVALAAGLALASAAQALTAEPVWTCRASASYTVINGGDRAETVVANGNVNTASGKSPDHASCASGEAGGGNLTAALGIPSELLAARSASAITSIDPELGVSTAQSVSATGRIEELVLRIPPGAAVTIGATVADAVATGRCSGTTPVLAGSSRVSGLTLGGAPVASADGLADALRRALASLAPTVTVSRDEVIRTADSLTIRALHIVVRQGSNTVVDAVVAETKVGVDGPVCSPPVDNRCPRGSSYVAATNQCVIPANDVDGAIGFGANSGLSGGTVMGIKTAIRRYGNSPCLAGSREGKVVLVGTNGSDRRLSGSSLRDRILGRGGNDRATGARNHDCIDGGPGRDTLSGELGNDRIYGAGGVDHLNGNSGSDRLYGGDGNDTINAGYGADRVLAGRGNDSVNIATAGPLASANCGPGTDTVRFNNRERKRIRACETRYSFKDK